MKKLIDLSSDCRTWTGKKRVTVLVVGLIFLSAGKYLHTSGIDAGGILAVAGLLLIAKSLFNNFEN